MRRKQLRAADLERYLNQALDDLTPLEKALKLAAAFRKAYGGEWTVEPKPDGSFSVVRK